MEVTVYKYKGEEYLSLYLLRKAMPLVVMPQNPTDELLAAVGVTVEKRQVTDPEPTQFEKENEVRKKRDELLEESDFFVMPDYPADAQDLEEVKAYRQALRDITEQDGFPDVIFPEKPNALRRSERHA